MSDPTTMRLAEPLIDTVMDAFRNLFPEKLKAVEQEVADGINLLVPMDGSYIYGLLPRDHLESVPAVMFDCYFGDMPEGQQDIAGAWDRYATLTIRFAVESSDKVIIPRLANRYVRAGALVIADDDNNGLPAGGYSPISFSDDYSGTMYNDDEKLFGRDAELSVIIHSVEG